MTINKKLIFIYFLVSYVVLALLRIVDIEPLDTPPTRVNLDLGPCKVVIWNFTPSDDFPVILLESSVGTIQTIIQNSLFP